MFYKNNIKLLVHVGSKDKNPRKWKGAYIDNGQNEEI